MQAVNEIIGIMLNRCAGEAALLHVGGEKHKLRKSWSKKHPTKLAFHDDSAETQQTRRQGKNRVKPAAASIFESCNSESNLTNKGVCEEANCKA